MRTLPIPTPDEAVPTATALDVGGHGAHLGPAIVRRAGLRTIGRALTVRTGAGDNLALHRAVAVAQPGDVLVVTCPGTPVGLAGEVICTALQALGARGLVTDSGVRDHDELTLLGLPVWSAAITPRGTTKHDPGTVGEPISIGGAVVRTGDIVIADGDGVVCLPPTSWPRVREQGSAKDAREQEWLDRLREGTPLATLTNLPGLTPPVPDPT